MTRTISSAQTFLFKFVFTPLWIGLFTVGAIPMFVGTVTDHGRPIDPQIKWIFLLVLAIGGPLIYRTCGRLKRVSMSDADLHISNFRREIVVPLGDIDEVTENRWLNIHPVTLRFTKRTEFGHSVVFMPKTRWFALFSSHPIVRELRDAADRARRGAK